MRRALPVALLSALLAVSPYGFAQHGNSAHAPSHSGGVHESFGQFHGGFSAPRSFSGYSGVSGRSFAAPPLTSFGSPRGSMPPGAIRGLRPTYGAESRGDGHGGRDRDRGRFRRDYRGYGYGGYAYPNAWIDSWELLPGDLGSSAFDDDTQSPAGQQETQQPAQPGPEQEAAPAPEPGSGYDAASDYGYRQSYVSPQGYAPPVPAAAIAPEPELTLIFKDGHTQPIRNYVLTPTDVIVMDEAVSGREPRIPLTELNLPATEQAAQQAGLDFSPPIA